MDLHNYLGDDGRAMLALCSGLGLRDRPDEPAPFTLSEWNRLAQRIAESPLKQPAALFGRTAEETSKDLAVPLGDAERITQLLERSGRLALDLEALFSRGIWAVTRADDGYPRKLKTSLRHQAPTVLFGAGELQRLRCSGVAVVGSRDIDEKGAAFAREVGRKAAKVKVPVVSGGARGADRLAMEGALEAGGVTFGVLADSLERTVRQPDLRQLLLDGQLVLLTPYAPAAGFSVGAAMGRNKVIYGLADFAVVASSDFKTGGTWAGAVEALKAGWCPVFARDGADVPTGNRELIKLGAAALPEQELPSFPDLPAWLREHAKTKEVEPDLFERQT